MKRKAGAALKVLLLLLLACAALLTACADGGKATPDQPPDQGKLRIFFIDVGKGDAALIGTPDGAWIMTDVGPEKEYAQVVRLLKQHGIERLEAIFISHPHNDHAGALADVLAHVQCDIVYTTPARFPDHTPRLLEMAGAAGVPVETLGPKDSLQIGGMDIDVLGPNGTFEKENDNSLVMMITFGGLRALFAGDQLADAERALLAAGRPVGCDVLKTGHHGEDDASSAPFLRAANPRYCVVTNDLKAEKLDEAVSRFAAFDAVVYVLGETGTMLCEMGEGAVNFYAVKPPEDAPVLRIAIDELDRSQAMCAVRNDTAQAVALGGWCLRPAKGKGTYFFADDAVIAPGERLVLYDDMFGAVKKKSSVILFDGYGREVDTY